MARFGLRANPEQEAVLRRAAEVVPESMADFILDAACQSYAFVSPFVFRRAVTSQANIDHHRTVRLYIDICLNR